MSNYPNSNPVHLPAAKTNTTDWNIWNTVSTAEGMEGQIILATYTIASSNDVYKITKLSQLCQIGWR